MLFLSSQPAFSKDFGIDSRVYKLLLDESKLKPDPLAAINALWNNYLKSAVDESVGLRANGTHRYSGKFTLSEERAIRYWDTGDSNKCALEKHGYSVRERVKVKDGEETDKEREVTLKFRSPDLYLTAKTEIKSKKNPKSKLEEDIVPIAPQE